MRNYNSEAVVVKRTPCNVQVAPEILPTYPDAWASVLLACSKGLKTTLAGLVARLLSTPWEFRAPETVASGKLGPGGLAVVSVSALLSLLSVYI